MSYFPFPVISTAGAFVPPLPRSLDCPPFHQSITLEEASEVKKRFVSLSASQVSSLETVLSDVCWAASWLDWWLPLMEVSGCIY